MHVSNVVIGEIFKPKDSRSTLHSVLGYIGPTMMVKIARSEMLNVTKSVVRDRSTRVCSQVALDEEGLAPSILVSVQEKEKGIVNKLHALMDITHGGPA